MCALRLINDDDLKVRQTVARLSVDAATLASHAEEKMVENFTSVLGKTNPLCQATLFLWAFGSVPDYCDDDADLEEVIDLIYDVGKLKFPKYGYFLTKNSVKLTQRQDEVILSKIFTVHGRKIKL